MIVVFGHSPKLGYLDNVQEYHFGNKEWAILETKGYSVIGGYGCALLDELTTHLSSTPRRTTLSWSPTCARGWTPVQTVSKILPVGGVTRVTILV